VLGPDFTPCTSALEVGRRRKRHHASRDAGHNGYRPIRTFLVAAICFAGEINMATVAMKAPAPGGTVE
jgi:hypothetical protein